MSEQSTDSHEKPDTTLALIDASDPRHNYDTDLIDDFLSLVFHTELAEDEEILVWNCKHRPGYPVTDDKLLSKLSRIKQPQALYYGMSTCTRDSEGLLYNRKSLFTRLHVVVLDDIGTKVSASILPEELAPTYIIESSEGNYQYGFVLEEPVDDLAHAEALIQIVYDSGYCDEGGKMPNKLVRLPEGINGKIGDKRLFNVKLIKDDGPRWTPTELLDVLDQGVTWEDILKDSTEAIRRRTGNNRTSAWSPIAANHTTLDGIIDPVLEWLYDEDMVAQETNDWVDIKCPWADLHSDTNQTAGYSPLGRGGDMKHQRGFNCFHGHCDNRTTKEFLQYVGANGGPEVPIFDHAARLIASWVYDAISDLAWDISQRVPRSISMVAFRNLHPQTVGVVTYEGKVKPVKEASLWLTAPNRVSVMGRMFDPTSPAKIVTIDDNMYINTYAPPQWGDGPYDEEDIVNFKAFINYLIPETEEREYFTQWLAAKVQNMGFRGAAIVMIAKKQGTGRGTLANMLATLLGQNNVENVPFAELSGDAKYNEWAEAPLVITDETLSLGEHSKYKVGERLKDIIDTTPKLTRINPKYGQQRRSMVCTSYLLMSNHADAMSIPKTDRRFYVIGNASQPADIDYFIQLHKWLNEKTEEGDIAWAQSVWRWLSAMDVDLGKLLAPAPTTAAKDVMLEASSSPLDIAVHAAMVAIGDDFFTFEQLRGALDKHFNRIYSNNMNNPTNIVNRMLRGFTESGGGNLRVAVESKRVRPKIMLNVLTEDVQLSFKHGVMSAMLQDAMLEDVAAFNTEKIAEAIGEALDAADL